MKKIVLLLIVCLTTLGTWGKAPQKQIKVLSWNVWHEGHQREYPGVGCQGTIGILKSSGADVIIMVETYGASQMVADSLGFHYSLISSNLSIYSRYPITEKYSFADQISTFNFGGVELDVDGQKVRVFATWLHYLPDMRLTPTDKSEQEILAWDNEGSRDEEVRAILNVLQPFIAQSDEIPLIMGGDFNAHSHLDWTRATRNMYNHGGAVVNWTVSNEMLQAGFIDSFRKANPNPAKNIGVTWLEQTGKQTEKRQDRIDFIYYQGDKLQLTDSQSHDTDLAKQLAFGGKEFFYASDHGFVLSTFTIK